MDGKLNQENQVTLWLSEIRGKLRTPTDGTQAVFGTKSRL